jgi:hypothetical protein
MFIRSVLCLLTVALSVSSAQARHWHWNWHSYGYHARDLDEDNPDRDQPRELHSPSVQDAGFGPAMTRLVRDCAQVSVGLKTLPLLQISPMTAAQRDAHEALRSTVARASDALAATCPKDAPSALPTMLAALMRVADGLIAALDAIRPENEMLYNSLSDEQKAHLVAETASARTPPRGLAAPDRTSRERRRAGPGAVSGQDDNCARWASSLRQWPVREIEATISLSDPQHAALYDVAASTYRAADTLRRSCPRGDSLTPVAHLAGTRQQVDALREAIGDIRPALDQFVDTLSDEQRARLGQVVNAGQARVSRARP